MSLQVERLEHNMAKLTIEVPAEEVEKALQAAYLKERGKISLPGFRKGRVPRQMIEKMYGPEVFYDEAANRMISEAYAKAYDECELELVSQPKIEITQLEKGKQSSAKDMAQLQSSIDSMTVVGDSIGRQYYR